jgi:hypothetical protein
MLSPTAAAMLSAPPLVAIYFILVKIDFTRASIINIAVRVLGTFVFLAPMLVVIPSLLAAYLLRVFRCNKSTPTMVVGAALVVCLILQLEWLSFWFVDER